MYKAKPENKRTTISISMDNYLILKKMGQTSDTFNEVLTKILEKQTGVHKIDVGGE